MIEIKNLTKSYDKKCILKNINLKINDNEQVSIIGKSGCGKSTLLRCIARLEKIDKGQILIDNENVNNIKKFYNKVGMVFQSFNLFENMTVLENLIIAPVKLKIQTKDEAIKLAKGYLKEINLENKINEYPKNLSGGEKQRVAIIRALMEKPKILLLDEAFSALDYQTRLMVTEDIFKILKAENITALMVTHDISEAISMSDRVIVLSERPATVKSIHKIDFEMENRTPLNCRENPKFSKYFNLMWKELGEKNI